MRTGVFCLGASVALGACASTAEVAPNVDPISVTSKGLPAQTLAPGECGLFGWDTAQPPQFVFFATERQILYLTGPDEIQTLQSKDAFPAEDYGPLQVSLGYGEPLIDGIRYASARITETLDDGFTRVRPLVVLQSCQSAGS